MKSITIYQQSIRGVSYLRSRLLIPNFTHNLQAKPDANKSDTSESKSISHSILENNGFITDFGAGLTINLPLGKRVLNKLTDLVREEMNKVGGQEIDMPTLCDLNLWSLTGRNELMGSELFRLKDRHNKDLCLCPTHEEIVTSLVSKFSKSISSHTLGEGHKSLRLYQITRKYRDESRPKHGLLRSREFVMKDMYTFHLDDECVNQTYSDICQAYETIFTRLDLNYRKAEASVGSMGGKKSHEYHVESPIGEDQIFICSKCSKAVSVDLINKPDKKIKQEDLCQLVHCGKGEKLATGSDHVIKSKRCIEIGHTFILNDRYTKQIPIEIEKTKSKSNVLMGCYGIGVSRLVQACVESNNENLKFPNWPLDIAPFKIGGYF